MATVRERAVEIPAGEAVLNGDLSLPPGAKGLVIFAHGSGSSRHSPRNRYVAGALQEAGLGTLLMDLLTMDEEAEDQYTRALRFDIPLLAGRLVHATGWVTGEAEFQDLGLGYFGASTGAAAALMAAAERPEQVKAIVSRGGRPDLADGALPKVLAPTLLIVGSNDEPVIGLNEQALARMQCVKELTLVKGATHLFEEPGTLEQVAELAAEWFGIYLKSSQQT